MNLEEVDWTVTVSILQLCNPKRKKELVRRKRHFKGYNNHLADVLEDYSDGVPVKKWTTAARCKGWKDMMTLKEQSSSSLADWDMQGVSKQTEIFCGKPLTCTLWGWEVNEKTMIVWLYAVYCKKWGQKYSFIVILMSNEPRNHICLKSL